MRQAGGGSKRCPHTLTMIHSMKQQEVRTHTIEESTPYIRRSENMNPKEMAAEAKKGRGRYTWVIVRCTTTRSPDGVSPLKHLPSLTNQFWVTLVNGPY
jgi:hypothetical protein